MNLEIRARTVSETERTQTVTLLTCNCGAAARLRARGRTGEGTCGWAGLLSKSDFIAVCFSNGKRSPLIPPLLLLSSTKNVNVLALSRELG